MATLLNKDNFKDFIKKWVSLVDFWAQWCWPCQQMLPIIEDFSKDMEWKVNVWKINVDENSEISWEFNIMSIPNIIIFKDGEMVENLVWVQSNEDLKEIVEKYL